MRSVATAARHRPASPGARRSLPRPKAQMRGATAQRRALARKPTIGQRLDPPRTLAAGSVISVMTLSLLLPAGAKEMLFVLRWILFLAAGFLDTTAR